MNTKIKILLVSVLSLTVLGTGGYLARTILDQRGVLSWSGSDAYRLPSDEIIPTVDMSNVLSSSQGGNGGSVRSDAPVAVSTEKYGFSHENSFSGGDGSSNGEFMGSDTYASRRSSRHSMPSYNGGSGMGSGFMSARVGSRSSSSSSAVGDARLPNVDLGSNSPFAAPRYDSGSDAVLIDPGSSDPDPKERIPVGDGIWLLLLLSVGYGGLRFFTKR